MRFLALLAPVGFGRHWRPFSLLLTMLVMFSSAQQNSSRPISFGTKLDPQTVIHEAQKLAASLTDSTASTWQAKGDQHRQYHFPAANADEPYRLCVPESWDGTSKLPLVMFLHGAGNDESSYLDANNKQMITLANEHGVILVSPLGDKGAYGTYLRLSAQFGNEAGAEALMAQVTEAREVTNSLSEQDVLNVLELVLHEYPIDRGAVYLTGHSMGSGGTWYIGGKYATYWTALAPMSGPFVQENGYPWDSLKNIPVFVTEGIQTPSIDGSRAVRDWMIEHGFKITYKEVDADHGGMIPLVLPDVFTFFDTSRSTTVGTSRPLQAKRVTSSLAGATVRFDAHSLTVTIAHTSYSHHCKITIFDIAGRSVLSRNVPIIGGRVHLKNLSLATGSYRVSLLTEREQLFLQFITTQ